MAHTITYAHIELVSENAARPDRPPRMPLLGLLSGAVFALALWTAIGWIIVALAA